MSIHKLKNNVFFLYTFIIVFSFLLSVIFYNHHSIAQKKGIKTSNIPLIADVSNETPFESFSDRTDNITGKHKSYKKISTHAGRLLLASHKFKNPSVSKHFRFPVSTHPFNTSRLNC